MELAPERGSEVKQSLLAVSLHVWSSIAQAAAPSMMVTPASPSASIGFPQRPVFGILPLVASHHSSRNKKNLAWPSFTALRPFG